MIRKSVEWEGEVVSVQPEEWMSGAPAQAGPGLGSAGAAASVDPRRGPMGSAP